MFCISNYLHNGAKVQITCIVKGFHEMELKGQEGVLPLTVQENQTFKVKTSSIQFG